MKNPKNIIGPRIKELRQKAGISPESLSKASGIPVPALLAIESQERPIRDMDIVSLAKALRVPPSDLFR